MTTPLWLQILGVGLALSGWGKVALDWWMARPKIRGRVLRVLHGQVGGLNGPGTKHAYFLPYVFLVNERKSPVQLIEFEFEALVGQRWVKLTRVYNAGALATQFANIDNGDGQTTQIPKFEESLLPGTKSALDFGKPAHGFVLFAHADEDGALQRSEAWRLICIDAFGNRHITRTLAADQISDYLLQELGELKLSTSARSGFQSARPTNRGS